MRPPNRFSSEQLPSGEVCGSSLRNCAVFFRIEQRLDLAQVAHRPLEMAAKRRRGLLVPFPLDEVEDLQMLPAMLG